MHLHLVKLAKMITKLMGAKSEYLNHSKYIMGVGIGIKDKIIFYFSKLSL